LLGPITDHQRFASQGILSLLFVGNVGAYKFSGDYFSPTPNPLVHTWSLSLEEQIYIFLPLILMLVLHNRKNDKKIFEMVLGALLTSSLISFLFPVILQPLYSRLGIEISDQFSFYSPVDRIWQFALGGLTFLWADRYHIDAKKISKGIHLLSVVAVLTLLFSQLDINLKISSFLISVFTIVAIRSKSFDFIPDFAIHKLVWIGDRSYSIYLVHMPLFYLAKYYFPTKIESERNSIIQTIIFVFVAIALGALSYSKIKNNFGSDIGLSTKVSKLSQPALLQLL
jgi:peptidoglycan/LPS O-acetylase OafA/YrhL